ncbi:hypothetical protein [Priestia aryabhattai]|uniref:hypothetical protein n=1 Tax=Priestia aryabhattai TaxID=412384 RepID=UPI001C8E4D20|nr:hypothetical protein [Priestia aryabhattai]MBY0062353.1 hypothetical protein [Priestia aryabhattai]
MKGLDTKKKFVELRAKGISFNKIAEHLEVSKTTLIEWSRDLEREIVNLKAIELDELQEMHYVQKQKRIELFGSQLERILKELEERDFSKIATEKLLELQIKYLDCLKREEVNLALQIEDQKRIEDMLEDMNKSIKFFEV